MPKHIVRLLALLIGFLVLAYAGIVYLTDPSFYRFGHFRADVVPELAAAEPVFRGPAYCQACHGERHAEWATSTHRIVKCEICHGPAGDHPANGKLPVPADTVRLCTACHEAMPGRPDTQPQIVVEDHPFPHDTPLDCTTCHAPHSPGIGATAAPDQESASGGGNTAPIEEPSEGTGSAAATDPPPVAERCVGCHGALGQGIAAFPSLAGMPAPQFIELMNRFRSGEQTSPMMAALAKALSEEEIKELAGYFERLPGSTP